MANGTMIATVLTTVVIDCFTPTIDFEDNFMTDIEFVYHARFWTYQRKAAKAARRRKLGLARLQAFKVRAAKAQRRVSRNKLVQKSAVARAAHRARVAAKALRKAERLEAARLTALTTPTPKANTRTVVRPFTKAMKAAIPRPVRKCRVPVALHRPGVDYFKAGFTSGFVQHRPAENLFTVLEAKAKRLVEQAAKALAGGTYNPGPSKRKLAYAERYKSKAPRKSHKGMEKKQSTNYKNPPNLGTVVGMVMAAPIFSNWDRSSMVYGNTPDPEGWADEICTLQPRRRVAATEPVIPAAPIAAPQEQVVTATTNCTALVQAFNESYAEFYPAKTCAWLINKGPAWIFMAQAVIARQGILGSKEHAVLKDLVHAAVNAEVITWLVPYVKYAVFFQDEEAYVNCLVYIGKESRGDAADLWNTDVSTGIDIIADILGQEDIHTIQDLNEWVLQGSTTEPQAAAPAVPNPAQQTQASDQPLTEGSQTVVQTTQLDSIEDNPDMTNTVVLNDVAGTSADWFEPIAGGVGFNTPAPTQFSQALVDDLVAKFQDLARVQVLSAAMETAIKLPFAGVNTIEALGNRELVKVTNLLRKDSLATAMTNMILTIRRACTQSLVVPEYVQVGVPGIVPKYFWDRMPGGEQINRLVNLGANGKLICERAGDSGAIAQGLQEHNLEAQLGKWVDGEFKYTFTQKFVGHITSIITWQERPSAIAGQPSIWAGLPKRTAQQVALGVLHAVRLKDTNLRVYVPQDVYAALKLFFTYGLTQDQKNPQPYKRSCTYVEVKTNWLQPASNLSFTDIRDAFRYLQHKQLENIPVLEGNQAYAPFTYVDVADGFQLHLAGGAMFHVIEGVNGTASVPYFKPATTASWLRIKPVLVGTMNGDNEYTEGEVAKLSALDVFWYAWESFGFMAMNRSYRRDSKTNNLNDLLVSGTRGATEFQRFIQKYIPVDLEEQVQGEYVTHRDLFNSERYSVVELAQPYPLEVRWAGGALVAYLPGEQSANVWSIEQGKRGSITEYIRWARNNANMMTPGRSKAINMVTVANRFYDLAIMPIANCDVFVGHKIVAARFNQLEFPVAKALMLDMFKANWKAWGLAKHPDFNSHDDLNGLVGADLERVVAPAIWANKHNQRALTKAGLGKDDWTKETYWLVLQQVFAVPHSNKGAKAIKRATSNFATTCELLAQRQAGWAFADARGKQRSYAQLITTALLFNLPTHDPGMGLVSKDAMKALYNSKRELAVIPMFKQDVCWFQLDERFAGLVRPITTAAQGQVGWAFNQNYIVKAGEAIGTIMLNDRVLEVVSAREGGLLKSVTWAYALEHGTSQYFTVYGTVRPQVCNSLKLRHGIKLNALGANLNFFLGYGPKNHGRNGGRLNGEDFGSTVNMLVPQDCDKGKDNFAFKLRLMGANYAYHAATHADMRELLVRTNNAVQRAMGHLVVDEIDDELLVDAGCCAAGHYAELNADFERRFTRAIWVYQQTPEPAIAEVIASQTLNKAICTNELKTGMGFDPWRFVGAAEAAKLTGVGDDNQVGLPVNLLKAIELAEQTGTYTAVDGGVGRAYIVTTAQGAITDEDTVVCHWVEDYDGRPHHQLLMRGYGWGRKDGLDFVYPAEVEYATIPQCLTDTSIMPFAMLDNALRGHRQLALAQTEQSIVNLELDRLLSSFSQGAKPVYVGDYEHCVQAPIVDLTNTTGQLICAAELTAPGLRADLRHGAAVRCPDDLFSADALAVLRSPEVNSDRYVFAQWLAHYCGDVVFKLHASADGQVCSAHLATIFEWGGGSLRHSGETAASALIDFFKLWIGGSAPHNADCLRATASYVRMLNTYLEGVGHAKGLLRGVRTVQLKAAASCLVPNDEVWVCAKDARHFAQVFGCAVEEIQHVGFRRMPMFRTNVSRIKFLSNADVSRLNKLYGITFSAGRVYMGTAQMYSNFGDLDGDAVELDNLTKAVAAGLITVDGFASIKAVLLEILGVDTFDYRYWAAGVPNQYIADHFNFGTVKRFREKSAITYKTGDAVGNLTTLDQFAEFQKAATTVQTTTVGKTYSAATLMGMFAELVPVVAEAVTALGESDWLQAFSWAQDANGARKVVYQLLQLYEIALGGYDPDMESVTLGYLVRAMNGEQDTQHWSNLTSVVERIDRGVVGNFSSVLPQAARLLEWNHVPVVEVQKALVGLGFAATDLDVFRDCFLMAGLSIKLPTLGDVKLSMVPDSLQLILSIVQGVLDTTQNKLFGEQGESAALEFFHALNTRLNAGEFADADTTSWLLALRDRIVGETVTGQLFKNYYLSWLNKQETFALVGGLTDVTAPAVAEAAQ